MAKLYTFERFSLSLYEAYSGDQLSEKLPVDTFVLKVKYLNNLFTIVADVLLVTKSVRRLQ